MHIDVEAIGELLRVVAEEEVMPKWRSLAAHEIEEKRSGEVVTVVDIAVENRLTDALRTLLPGSRVVGEEAAEHDPLIFDHLAHAEDPVWIIDPVDGTNNFSRGKESFGVMLALVRAGETLASWIYTPVSDRMAVAEHSGGCYLNGERVALLSTPDEDADFRGPVLAGYFGNRDLGKRIQAQRDRVQAQKSERCAAVEYLKLLEAENHFVLFMRVKPWDHAPGVFLHKEAGGTGRFLDGRLYSAALHDEEGLLVAPNDEAWRRLYRILVEPALRT